MGTLHSEADVTSGANELASGDAGILQTETADDAASLVSGLSIIQMSAFEVLTSGGTIAAAARAANVTRKSIYDWMKAGNRFAVAYEQWKSSIAETSRNRLLMIGEAATVQIARSIKKGDTSTALAIAKGMGLLTAPPAGPSMAQSAAKKNALEAQRAEEEQADRLSAMPFRDLVDVGEFRMIDE